jgi:hypothetical protein
MILIPFADFWNQPLGTMFDNFVSYSLYIRLQELRIISFSVVNLTEKSRCCQLDLGRFFSMIGKNCLQDLLEES